MSSDENNNNESEDSAKGPIQYNRVQLDNGNIVDLADENAETEVQQHFHISDRVFLMYLHYRDMFLAFFFVLFVVVLNFFFFFLSCC